MNERWLPVPGYDDRYSVSDLGNVRTRFRQGSPGGLLKASPGTGKVPYRRVTLHDGAGGRWFVEVHVLVLTAFVGPCPAGLEGRHLDGNCQNNRLSNLKWDTHSENMLDVGRHRRVAERGGGAL